MGTSAAYFYSVYSVVAGVFSPSLASGSAANFFETSAVLISFVLMGKWLEARAKAGRLFGTNNPTHNAA
jgi:Cu+-exporting ATPase